MTDQTQEPNPDLFGVYAEAKDQAHLLIMVDIPFPKLIDDIVKPYQGKEPFFIDGAPVTPDDLKRIKIFKQGQHFSELWFDLHHAMRDSGVIEMQRMYADQYHIRLEAVVREAGEDVTSQVLKAFDQAIKPSIGDYLSKRTELIKGAFQVFIEAVKLLNST